MLDRFTKHTSERIRDGKLQVIIMTFSRPENLQRQKDNTCPLRNLLGLSIARPGCKLTRTPLRQGMDATSRDWVQLASP
jgi:hypothetical protein